MLLRDLEPTEEESRQVLGHQLQVFLSHATAPILVTAIGSCWTMAFIAWWNAPAPRGSLEWAPWLWCLLLSAALARTLQLSMRYKRQGQALSQAVALGRVFIGLGLVLGLLWGAASWLLLPHPDPNTATLLVVATAVALLGAAAGQAVYRPALMAFLLPATAVFVAGLLRSETWEFRLVGISFALLSFVVLAAARLQEEAVRAAIFLRLRSERLLAEKVEQQKLIESARAEAERANLGKTSFLAAAGHDLRQPMHALTLYHGHLQSRNADPALHDTIERIGKSIDAMQDLLDSVLQVSRLMLGAVKPAIAHFPLARVLERLDAQLRPLAEHKGLAFEVNGSAAVLHTDELLLERILRNLVMNAIRYTDRGSVRVRCGTVGSRTRIAVADTGLGIRREHVAKVFEEFFQVDNEARDRRKGLGLGLSIVRHLCELLGLRLRLRTRFGRGTVFTLHLPPGDPARVPAAAVPDARPDHTRGAFVVLVEDNEDSREATALALAGFGCRVLAVRSGSEAIERLDALGDAPQLIVSDLRLEGGQTGLDAVRSITERQRELHGDEFRIPALIVSGDTGPAEMRQVQQAGLPMLHKPVRLDVLYREVNALLATLATEA